MSTANGYDPRWIRAINTVLEERETRVRITDITDNLWERFIGPMIDAIEYGDDEDLVVYRTTPEGT